ncbi:N-acetylmuramoyl-L-alanine amidase [Anseongella ginsenosidimutans]|nr:N-acetylmuramoyl-L-alanine amidase [Anseongella ginsenosidimutans]
MNPYIQKITRALGILLLITGCAREPYSFSKKIYRKQLKAEYKQLKRMEAPVLEDSLLVLPSGFIPTTNFNLRKPNFVVIHHTAQNSCDQTYRTFTLQRTQVSAHYVICKDGTVTQMLSDYLRAWHGGAGKWGNVTDLNSVSIGIELDNNGYEPFSHLQVNSLLVLLDSLKTKYRIPAANFIGHADIAPTRKQDPNAHFPWKTLAKNGFGLWYDDLQDTVPDGFDPMNALRLIGYDTSHPEAAIKAFKLHFVQRDTSPQLTAYDKRILFNLVKKFF